MQYGLIEIKCPYKYRNLTPEDACLNGDFCSTLSTSKQIQLKRNHPYYSQIQGQLAMAEFHNVKLENQNILSRGHGH